MARTVTSPDGRTWKVGRRWLTRKPRWRGKWSRDALDLADGAEVVGFLDDGNPFAAILIAVAAILFFVLLFVAVVPVIVLAIEAVLAMVVLAASVLARFILRKPWIVEAAVPGTTQRQAWKVVGWRASGRVVDEVAGALESGARRVSPPGATPVTRPEAMGAVRWSAPFES